MKLKKLCENHYGQNIDLSHRSLTKLPSDLPKKINGVFICNENLLTTLEWCPLEVGDIFDCSANRLTSLEHCPKTVGGAFRCSSNALTSLEHCPAVVGYEFYCSGNKITSLKDIHKMITEIGGTFYCHRNPIKTHILGIMLIDIGKKIHTELGDGTDVDEILNKWKNQGRKGVLGAQRELIEAGYRELAQL